MTDSIRSHYVFNFEKKLVIEKDTYTPFSFNDFKKYIKRKEKDLKDQIMKIDADILHDQSLWPLQQYSELDLEIFQSIKKSYTEEIQQWQGIHRNLQIRSEINKDPEHRSLDVSSAKQVPIGNFIEINHNKAVCPFHNEKTASFHVNSNNTYKCFGCGEFGDVINLVQKLYNYSFVEAVRMLNREAL